MYLLVRTNCSWIPLILRIMLGLTFFVHGSQKLFGWFGGYGFQGTMQYFTGDVGLPWMVGLLVILIECIGGLLLALGVLTRLFAAAITFLVLGIVKTVHWQFGFFMNWEGNQAGEGIEFFLLVLAISVSLFITGGGRYSADRQIQQFIDGNGNHPFLKRS